VEAAIRYMESRPLFNAGLVGSAETSIGTKELEAGIMDGATLAYGSVVQTLEPHPISRARDLMDGLYAPFYMLSDCRKKNCGATAAAVAAATKQQRSQRQGLFDRQQ